MKLFQFVVWVWMMYLSLDWQPQGVDPLATFMFGGLCAYWATGFLLLGRIGAASLMRAARDLFLLKKVQQPAARVPRRQARQNLIA